MCCPYLAILSPLIKELEHVKAPSGDATLFHWGARRPKERWRFWGYIRSLCLKHKHFFLWLWPHKLYITDCTLYLCGCNTCICCVVPNRPHTYVCWCFLNEELFISKQEEFGAPCALNLSLPAPSAGSTSWIKTLVSEALREYLFRWFISVRGAVLGTSSRCLSNLARTSEVTINHVNVSRITRTWFAASGL